MRAGSQGQGQGRKGPSWGLWRGILLASCRRYAASAVWSSRGTKWRFHPWCFGATGACARMVSCRSLKKPSGGLVKGWTLGIISPGSLSASPYNSWVGVVSASSRQDARIPRRTTRSWSIHAGPAWWALRAPFRCLWNLSTRPSLVDGRLWCDGGVSPEGC